MMIQTNMPGLVRDERTGAIINMNISELNQHMAERNRSIENQQINKRVDELSDTVNEIKQLLQALVNQNGSQSSEC
jgi:uncharacterized coiled-coil protein SlyX